MSSVMSSVRRGLITGGILLIVYFLLVEIDFNCSGVVHSRTKAMRTLRLNQLRCVVYALLDYQELHGCLPMSLEEVQSADKRIADVKAGEFWLNPETLGKKNPGTWVVATQDPADKRLVIRAKLSGDIEEVDQASGKHIRNY